MATIKPFLKYAGAKTKMLPVLLPLLTGKRLVEPFAGSAAVSLNVTMPCLVADSNADVIGTFEFFVQHGEAGIEHAAQFFGQGANTERTYYTRRAEFNAVPVHTPSLRACLFAYLNRHGFNGLCRYNRTGGFNVPFGRYTNPGFPEQALKDFVRESKRMEFRCADFRDIFKEVRKGDVVYADPPYTPLSDTSNFTAYGQAAFGVKEHEALAECCRKAARKGARVVITNHDTPVTRKLYDGAEIRTVEVRRSIAASAGSRGNVNEIIAIFK